ncbi:MAG: hypothetical protein ACRC33_27175 [Gemmataceae bacterium]
MNHRMLALALFAGATALTAKMLMIAPPPAGMRAAAAQAVVVGKVIMLADSTVPAEMHPGDDRLMMVATVKVQQTLLGERAREVKVGYFLPPPANPGVPVRSSRGLWVNLAVGQEALLMLRPHPTRKGVMVVADHFGVINKAGNPAFDAEVDDVKKAAKLIADPAAGLRAADPAERLRATALLITRYRTPPTDAATATEKLSAQESKLILTNLAEADWTAVSRGGRPGMTHTPQALFFRLGVTPADGWAPPREFAKLPAAARAWLTENAGKYRVVRYARPTTGADADPEP